MAEQPADDRRRRLQMLMRTFWLAVTGLAVVIGVLLIVAAIGAGDRSAAIGIGILLLLVGVPTLLTNVWIMRKLRAGPPTAEPSSRQ